MPRGSTRSSDPMARASSRATSATSRLKRHDYAEARARFETSLAASRKREPPVTTWRTISWIWARPSSLSTSTNKAGVWFSECLPICESLGFRELLSWVFEGVAAISVSRGDTAGGARLLGAAKAIQEGDGHRRQLLPGRPRVAGTDDASRKGRSSARRISRAAWRDGKELGLDEAIALAKSALGEAS